MLSEKRRLPQLPYQKLRQRGVSEQCVLWYVRHKTTDNKRFVCGSYILRFLTLYWTPKQSRIIQINSQQMFSDSIHIVGSVIKKKPCKQGCGAGVGVVGSRRFLGGVGFLATLRVGVGFLSDSDSECPIGSWF